MTDIESLVARLGRKETRTQSVELIGGTFAEDTWMALVNPDGPEAIAAIRTLQTEKMELREALLPFAELAGGDVNMNDPLRKWLTVAHLVEAAQALSNTGEME